MLSRFLLTLVFSWLVTPLWVAIAHWRGFGADQGLQILLLTQGASVPFQLFLNECLAVGQVRAQRMVRRSVIFFVILSQILTCSVSLAIGVGDKRASLALAFGFAVAFAASNFISYKVACEYYDSVLNDGLTKRESICIGLVPGVTMLILYSGFFELLSRGLVGESAYLALLVPASALAQWYFLKFVTKGRIAQNFWKGHAAQSVAAHGYFAVGALMIVSYFLTGYRDFFSQLAPAYGALIVVGLNTLSSVANTVTRAGFLMRGHQIHRLLLLMGACACFFALVIIPDVNSVATSFFMLLGLQFSMIAVIEYARGLVVASGLSPSIQG